MIVKSLWERRELLGCYLRFHYNHYNKAANYDGCYLAFQILLLQLHCSFSRHEILFWHDSACLFLLGGVDLNSLKLWVSIELWYCKYFLHATKMRSWLQTISWIICMSLTNDMDETECTLTSYSFRYTFVFVLFLLNPCESFYRSMWSNSIPRHSQWIALDLKLFL